jgi:lipopolysaccharide cholinephosphotransferase
MKIYTDKELNLRNEGLQEIKKVFSMIKLHFFLIDGILLGAVRENNFIKWDWDVELAVFSEEAIYSIDDIVALSKSSGFDTNIVDSSYKNLKITLHKYDTKYTIVGLYKKNKYRMRKTFKYPSKHFECPASVNFLGESYLVPGQSEDFLTFTYGSDWRTPKMSSVKEEYLSRDVFIFNWKTELKFIMVKFKKFFQL